MNDTSRSPGLHAACLAQIEAGLRGRGQPSPEAPEAVLAALWHLAAGQPMSTARAVTVALPRLDAAAAIRLRRLVDEHVAGTPASLLTRRQRFMGLEMIAGPQAAPARPETEGVARRAFALLARRDRGAGAPSVLDLCAGAAHVAAALAALVPSARIVACDPSADALLLAHDNLVLLGLDGRVELRRDPGNDAVDLLVCQVAALAASLAADAAAHVRPGGWVVVEVDPADAPALRRHWSATGAWAEVVTEADAQGAIRVLSARRASAAPPAPPPRSA